MNTELIWRASLFAAEAHALQKRKSNHHAYFNHVLRVAHMTWQAGLSEDAVAAAFLHDTVEDTGVKIEEIERKFSRRVAELVHLLTQWWPDDAAQDIKKTEIPKYYTAISKDAEAVAIKLFDRADNLKEMARTVHLVPRWAAKYLAKSESEINLIMSANRSDLARSEYEESLRELREALVRYEAGSLS